MLAPWEKNYDKSRQRIKKESYHFTKKGLYSQSYDGASGKEPDCQRRRLKRHGFLPLVRKTPWRGPSNPLQYFFLENPMDRRAWWAIVYRVEKLRDWACVHAHTHTHTRFLVIMYGCELNHKEGCVSRNWCFWTVLEKTLSSLDSKAIKPVNPKENQLWIFIIRTDAETPILWQPDANSWLIGKDPDAGKDWGWQRMRWLDSITNSIDMTRSKLWDNEEQGSLECCSPWGCKELDTT